MKKDKKKKKIIFICILVSVVVLWLLWFFLLSKLYIFSQNEKKLSKIGEDYFEINKKKLPNKEGEVASVSLKTLYKEKWLTAIYVPKSDKLCDAEESWVKVRLEDGNYKYYTYLSCGKYESKVDHEGPVITLNGKDTITIDRGDSYQDKGIKSIEDNIDGELDKTIVKIKQEVDTTKIGSYKVTYTAYDSMRNKTEKTRVVQVVDMLNTVTKNKTNSLGYFKGNVLDNYVLFSGMLFRIVGVNSDNTIKLISAYTVSNMNYNTPSGSFIDSDMKDWLNGYFYDHINEDSKKYIVNSTWCNDKISENELDKKECSSQTKKAKVGLLSIAEFNRSLDGNESFLESPYMFWMLNRKDKDFGYVNRDDFAIVEGKRFLTYMSNTLLGVRPVINVSSDIAIVSGSGKELDPYRLIDYKKAKKESKLNTRISGEYLTYSGYLWRIMEVDSSGNTKVVMDQTINENGNEVLIQYENKDNAKIYNVKEKGNVGYQIVNKMTSYVNTKLFVSKEVSVPIYEERANYIEKNTEKYKVKISAPNAYEIFSAKNTSSDYSSYWYINSSKEDGIKYVMANLGSPYTMRVGDDKKAGVKLVAYFNKNVRITEGSGVRNDPYVVKG